MTEPRFLQIQQSDLRAEHAATCAALLAPQASIAPKYFYDRLGSMLFEAITALPEYYPTRTEAGIFELDGAAMARAVGTVGTMFDLGAGNCAKAAGLFPLIEPARYVAVDVSVEFVREALRRLHREHPRIEMVALGMDFSTALALPAGLSRGRPLFFYPGSSIGNFTPDEALAFLRRVRSHADDGALLVGVDLVKAKGRLEAAYDDPLGVTAAFNLNMLRHLNAVIGSDFEVSQWRHMALYDERASRIEMHLQARSSTVVSWPSGGRSFEAGERILTEYSYKYTVDGFESLLGAAGFSQTRIWRDERSDFAVFLGLP
ncbi:L-histidine N(alpha)-methyltransferase [uncultured Piscinibacter sp.]|uniref:L-histidine N(alpha)-methyltransferase n=1 Tax=uncultured Piscinibacter sp. TaxID=1131835 RepID=UPI0026108DFE|nr:L-histidine N(alpha)-methyltransferase [uncultured Piscinibacter sp.]